jgi:hypothetical protein
MKRSILFLSIVFLLAASCKKDDNDKNVIPANQPSIKGEWYRSYNDDNDTFGLKILNKDYEMWDYYYGIVFEQGSYTMTPSTITFKPATLTLCHHQNVPITYNYYVSASTLSLINLTDTCSFRTELLGKQYSRVK